jgi:hypothetical protein
MKTNRFFRYLWRVNAVLIFVATGGICLLAGSLMLTELGCNIQRRRAVEAAPPVVANAEEKLYLGPVRAVEGTHVLRGELQAPRRSLGISSSGYSAETRNILYLDIASTEARWLLPDSTHVISDEAPVWSENQGTTARQQVAGLALVKPKTADLELMEGTLLIFDASGRQVTTIAEGVRALNHASLVDTHTILVLYERGRRYVRAMVDAQSLKVISVHDVSVPELR